METLKLWSARTPRLQKGPPQSLHISCGSLVFLLGTARDDPQGVIRQRPLQRLFLCVFSSRRELSLPCVAALIDLTDG